VADDAIVFEVGDRQVRRSGPDTVLVPESGRRKRDVVGYYEPVLRTGFKSRMAFGGVESPAVCQSRAVVMMPLLGMARDRQTCGDPGLARTVERTRGLRRNESRLSKRFPPDLRAGIRSRSLRAPDRTRDS
jgi:hypothetical protein